MSDTTDIETPQAVRVWSALYDYVNAQDRRRELQEALGLGGGFGRVKVLLHLEGGPMTLRDIAESNGMDAPYATVICDKLAEKGLVVRTPHPDDNRRKLVSLTETGRTTAALARRILGEPPDGLSALTPSELSTLEGLLTKLTSLT
jgi:DNA-binding MarR family transcriptional regulator